MTTTYEVPVLIKVTVEVDDKGGTRILKAQADSECAPWAGSSEPVAWEPKMELWTQGYDDDDPNTQIVWEAAYHWLEMRDLVALHNLAPHQAAMADALRAFIACHEARNAKSMAQAYRAAQTAIKLFESEPRDPLFKRLLHVAPGVTP